MRSCHCNIELLEARIAPSAVFTFMDGDADSVKVTSSKGTNAQLASAFTLSGGASGNPTTIDLTLLVGGVHVFSGADISLAATASVGGDGFVHVGYINATGVDLGKIGIDGDLAKITAGDATRPASAIKALTVRSYGILDVSTGAPDVTSHINGRVDALTIKGDLQAYLDIFDTAGTGQGRLGLTSIGGSVVGATLSADGFGTVKIRGDIGRLSQFLSTGGIDSFAVGGSMVGNGSASSSRVQVDGDIGAIRIGQNLVGGGGDQSGRIRAHHIGSVSIGGSVIGGSGNDNLTPGEEGQIVALGSLGSVKVGGNLEGGAGQFSASIRGSAALGRVSISGSIVGGSGMNSASLNAPGTSAGAIIIGHDIRNGPGAFAGDISYAAFVPSITVGGSIDASASISAPSISLNSGVGSFAVKGNIVNAFISSLGIAPGPGVRTLAFKSISVGGSVRNALIAAGYAGTAPSNSEVQIGSVTVGGDWVASTLVCGCEAGGDGNFGTPDDNLIGPSAILTNTIAKIGRIAIKGQVQGTPFPADTFGFVAEQIGAISVGGHALPLVSGPASLADIHFVGVTGDTRYLEVIF